MVGALKGTKPGSMRVVCTCDGNHGVDARSRHLYGWNGLGLAIAAPLQLQHACKHRRFLTCRFLDISTMQVNSHAVTFSTQGA